LGEPTAAAKAEETAGFRSVFRREHFATAAQNLHEGVPEAGAIGVHVPISIDALNANGTTGHYFAMKGSYLAENRKIVPCRSVSAEKGPVLPK
jgi:hypothetical protein